ncbi:hypothetical protein TRFO_31531 [Tritrichomonas foetus]|uniref:Rab-GAP TBC domain-containing protein n=1 Tax=Tritrichomonas foetus TaxID=1144522 RepID=A0A1J4JVT0_9EUKA|nr:hypothetical protein TRFO_31531 [Tritrichomonas foetus]|eukprot:OHT01644.1 hypothetical protein TRFO_31531 [Tritrichomonas foetus]
MFTKSHRRGMSTLSEKEVELGDIDAAVYRLSGLFFSMDDANAFLSSAGLSKNNATRFICWLISFNIISPNHEKWALELFKLYKDYKQMLNSYIKDPSDPLIDVPVKSATVIESDIMRGMRWFQSLAADLKLNEYYISDVELRANRILAVCSLDSPHYSYTQGHDRYLFISFLLALEFSAQSGLSRDFAEAIAFYLARDFISMTAISKYLDNVTETEDHFEKMDREMAKVAPEIMRQLFDVGQSSIHFALRWELLLFADEYDIKRLLYLWDQILYYKNIFKKFLFALCIAHIQQITPAMPGEIMVEKIQTFRNWNVQQILSDAMKYIKSIELVKPRIKMSYIIATLSVLVFLLYFYFLIGRNL